MAARASSTSGGSVPWLRRFRESLVAPRPLAYELMSTVTIVVLPNSSPPMRLTWQYAS